MRKHPAPTLSSFVTLDEHLSFSFVKLRGILASTSSLEICETHKRTYVGKHTVKFYTETPVVRREELKINLRNFQSRF